MARYAKRVQAKRLTAPMKLLSHIPVPNAAPIANTYAVSSHIAIFCFANTSDRKQIEPQIGVSIRYGNNARMMSADAIHSAPKRKVTKAGTMK